MRIGIDTAFYSDQPTGIGRYIYELCYHLKQYKDIELVLFLSKNSPLLKDKYFADNEKVIVNYSKLDLRRLYVLGKKVDNANLDLFHSTAYNIPFIKKTKYIVSLYDLIHLKFTKEYGLSHKLYYQMIVKNACHKSEKIITISESSKKDLIQWLNCDPQKIEITPLSANKNFVPHIGISDLFYSLDIDQNNFILYVGNNRPNKNLERLLTAYTKIIEKFDNFPKLILTCKSNKDLNDLIANFFIKDKIFFLENVSEDDLILLYSYAMFFIFPSYYEGFGLPLVEAMSTGCPITCSDISSIPEVTADAALYFDPYDINDMSLALEKMYTDYGLRNYLSEKGLARSKEFSWEKTAYQTYLLYKEIIAN